MRDIEKDLKLAMGAGDIDKVTALVDERRQLLATAEAAKEAEVKTRVAAVQEKLISEIQRVVDASGLRKLVSVSRVLYYENIVGEGPAAATVRGVVVNPIEYRTRKPADGEKGPRQKRAEITGGMSVTRTVNGVVETLTAKAVVGKYATAATRNKAWFTKGYWAGLYPEVNAALKPPFVKVG